MIRLEVPSTYIPYLALALERFLLQLALTCLVSQHHPSNKPHHTARAVFPLRHLLHAITDSYRLQLSRVPALLSCSDYFSLHHTYRQVYALLSKSSSSNMALSVTVAEVGSDESCAKQVRDTSCYFLTARLHLAASTHPHQPIEKST